MAVEASKLARAEIPQACGAAKAGGEDELAVRGEGAGGKCSGVAAEASEFGAGGGVPDACGHVEARGEELIVRRRSRRRQ